MARFGGMTRAVKLLSLFLVASLTLSGCSMDFLRPDLFYDSDMRAFPEWLDPESAESSDGGESRVQQGQEVSVWPNGSPKGSGYSYTPKSNTDNTDTFAGMPRDTLQCEDYSIYLMEQIFNELQTAILQLPPEVRNKLYLRVGHTGYNLSNGKLRRGTGQQDNFTGDEIRSERFVGGDVLLAYFQDWVGGLPENSDHVQLQVEAAQRAIAAAAKEGDWSQSWYGLGSSSIPQAYLNMMGRDGASFATLRDYYDAIAADPYHNIPNFSLQMRAGESSTESVTFNPASTSQAVQFHTGVSLDTLDKAFRVQNQYADRNRTPVDETKQETSSLMRYYIDGYNKTVIFIGCKDGEDLIDLVGEDTYRYFLNKISNAYMCTDVEQVKSIVPTTEYDDVTGEAYQIGPDYSGFVPIPAGTKGAD